MTGKPRTIRGRVSSNASQKAFIRRYISESALSAFDALGYDETQQEHVVSVHELVAFITGGQEYIDGLRIDPFIIAHRAGPDEVRMGPGSSLGERFTMDSTAYITAKGARAAMSGIDAHIEYPSWVRTPIDNVLKYLVEAPALARAYWLTCGGPKRADQ